MEQPNLYIGVDLHLRTQNVTVMDKMGNNKQKFKFLNDDRDGLFNFYNSLPRTSSIAIEATYNWPWFVDFLEDMDHNPKLSHPKKTRIIAESALKSDDIDSEVLAHLDRLNYLPLAYIPSKGERSLRELLRMRLFFVKIRTSLKNRTHSLLAKWGICHCYSDLFGKAGREFLKNLTLDIMRKETLTKHIDAIIYIDEQIHQMEKLIKGEIKDNPIANLLMTIPGIGPFLAFLLAIEIGPITRFASFKKLVSYSGLSSRIHQSADKLRYGHINKDSNFFIRWALIEAVDHAIRKDPKLYSLYNKVMYKKGKSKARIAIARKLLISIYFMLKDNEPYRLSHNFQKKTKVYRLSPCAPTGNQSW